MKASELLTALFWVARTKLMLLLWTSRWVCLAAQVRSLFQVFVDCEQTHRSNVFYEKFHTRLFVGETLGEPCA
jgi:Ubiquitin elongating factor core